MHTMWLVYASDVCGSTLYLVCLIIHFDATGTGVSLGRGGGALGGGFPQYFFYLRIISFLASEVKRGK